MIEKSEKEAMREREMAKHVRKKTHKGEVEVEDEDLSTLEVCGLCCVSWCSCESRSVSVS